MIISQTPLIAPTSSHLPMENHYEHGILRSKIVQANTGTPSWWHQFFEFINGQPFKTLVIYCVIISLLIPVGIFIYRLVNGGVGIDISQVPFTRGLITVLLLASTLLMVLMVIINLLLASDPADAKDRTATAREVLTPLLGIVGTIVGFYFGSASQFGGAPSPGALVKIQSLGGILRGDTLLLDGTAVQDADLAQLAVELPHLVGVSLDNTTVGNKGLEALRGLKELKWVSLKGVRNVTSDGVESLKKTLPEVQVFR